MIELIVGIVEGIFTLVIAIFEGIASLFSSGSGALSIGEVLIVFMCVLLELVNWIVLWCKELLVSLFSLRKPKMINKPVLWRPREKDSHTKKINETD